MHTGRRLNGYVWAVDAEPALEQGAVLLSVFSTKTLCPLPHSLRSNIDSALPLRINVPSLAKALPCWRALQLLLLLLLVLPLLLLVLDSHAYIEAQC